MRILLVRSSCRYAVTPIIAISCDGISADYTLRLQAWTLTLHLARCVTPPDASFARQEAGHW